MSATVSAIELWCQGCRKPFVLESIPTDLTRCPWCLNNRFQHTRPRRKGGDRLSGADKRRRRRAVVKRDGEKCAECGTVENLTLDHVRPWSKGGSNGIDNLQLLCVDCNQAKADSLPEELS